jgi:hypothetical protein
MTGRTGQVRPGPGLGTSFVVTQARGLCGATPQGAGKMTDAQSRYHAWRAGGEVISTALWISRYLLLSCRPAVPAVAARRASAGLCPGRGAAKFPD